MERAEKNWGELFGGSVEGKGQAWHVGFIEQKKKGTARRNHLTTRTGRKEKKKT